MLKVRPTVSRGLDLALTILVLASASAAFVPETDALENVTGVFQVTERAIDGETMPPESITEAVDEVLNRSAYVGERRGLFGFLTDNPVFRILADWWQRFVDWLNSLFEDDEPELQEETSQPDSGRSSFGIPLLIGVALIAALLAALLARRRMKVEEVDFMSDPHAELNTAEMASEADNAASSGDHELSVRLRFKSGLLALDRRGIIAYDEAEPLGVVRRTVDEPDFDRVADGFERVTYSEYVAETADSESAKTGWFDLLKRSEKTDDD